MPVFDMDSLDLSASKSKFSLLDYRLIQKGDKYNHLKLISYHEFNNRRTHPGMVGKKGCCQMRGPQCVAQAFFKSKPHFCPFCSASVDSDSQLGFDVFCGQCIKLHLLTHALTPSNTTFSSSSTSPVLTCGTSVSARASVTSQNSLLEASTATVKPEFGDQQAELAGDLGVGVLKNARRPSNVEVVIQALLGDISQLESLSQPRKRSDSLAGWAEDESGNDWASPNSRRRSSVAASSIAANSMVLEQLDAQSQQSLRSTAEENRESGDDMLQEEETNSKVTKPADFVFSVPVDNVILYGKSYGLSQRHYDAIDTGSKYRSLSLISREEFNRRRTHPGLNKSRGTCCVKAPGCVAVKAFPLFTWPHFCPFCPAAADSTAAVTGSTGENAGADKWAADFDFYCSKCLTLHLEEHAVLEEADLTVQKRSFEGQSKLIKSPRPFNSVVAKKSFSGLHDLGKDQDKDSHGFISSTVGTSSSSRDAAFLPAPAALSADSASPSSSSSPQAAAEPPKKSEKKHTKRLSVAIGHLPSIPNMRDVKGKMTDLNNYKKNKLAGVKDIFSKDKDSKSEIEAEVSAAVKPAREPMVVGGCSNTNVEVIVMGLLS